MDVICTPGAGWDVQQKAVMAWRVTPEPTGQQADGLREVKACGTTTAALLGWSDWLTAAGMTPVALERTGEDWKPVDTLWAGDGPLCLVHAAPVPQVPGRTTDTAAARWLPTRRR